MYVIYVRRRKNNISWLHAQQQGMVFLWLKPAVKNKP